MAKPEYSQVDEDILKELGELEDIREVSKYTPLQERVIIGFEDIQRFFDEHGRVPLHGEERDIFERIYAVRLDKLATKEEYRELLKDFDHHNLLSRHQSKTEKVDVGDMDDDEILSHFEEDFEASDITDTKHVRPNLKRQSPDEVAVRKRCNDFDKFKHQFHKVQKELNEGVRTTRLFKGKAEIDEGKFFIVGGQIAYVVKRGKDFINDHGETDARLRVIYSNGTESNLLMRSLQRSLRQDGAGRRITNPKFGPLFGHDVNDQDELTGTVYILESLSEDENVRKYPDLCKIGVTKGSVERRIRNAKFESTYLFADVKVVKTIKIFNFSPNKVENWLHQIFERARCNFVVKDPSGKVANPKEWFFVPIFLIEEAVNRIIDGSIDQYTFDLEQMRLVERS